MERQRVSAATPWEEIFGYSRAVRVGNSVHVGGTTAVDEKGTVYGKGDMYTQTAYTLGKIEKALHELGATMNDVVRTRLYVTKIDDLEAIAKAHNEYLGDVRPASTLIEVSAFVSADLLIEIEADAIISQ